MRVTFPHMGNMWLCIKAMLEYLEVETVVPPICSKKTLSLGSMHSPEFACMPLKLNLGNFIEAHELGADTIIMAGGCGPCRFGYYAQVEHKILVDLGYPYDLVVIEPPEKHISELISRIRHVAGNKRWIEIIKAVRFGYRKIRLADELEMQAMHIRPRELLHGSTEQYLSQAIEVIDKAATPYDLKRAAKDAQELMSCISCEDRPLIKIGVIGEIYTLLEPFANMDIDKKLGRLGVQVDRSMFLSEWINDHLFKGLLRNIQSSQVYLRNASPYLKHFVGGHGQETVGSAVYYSKMGYDGIIQVLPFTCMPEIVAQSILPRVSQDTGVPIITLIVDEQSGDAGINTRLEAFVDLLIKNKQQKARLA